MLLKLGQLVSWGPLGNSSWHYYYSSDVTCCSSGGGIGHERPIQATRLVMQQVFFFDCFVFSFAVTIFMQILAPFSLQRGLN